MSDLTNLIEKLSREEALEAAHNLALQITQNASSSAREEELSKPFIDKPDENIQEIEQLARLILLTAVGDAKNAETVRSAIREACRKQVILDGTETVVLATLGLFTLNLLITREGSPERGRIKIKDDTGRATFVIENQVSYGISSSLAKVLRSYFGREQIGRTVVP